MSGPFEAHVGGGRRKPYLMYQPQIVPVQPMKKAGNLDKSVSGLFNGAPGAFGLQNGELDLSSSWVVGSITANNIIVNQLSAISSNLGTVTIGTGGSLSSGQSAYNTGTGFWMEYNGGTPRMSLGSSSAGLTWDGTTFTAKGVLNVTGSSSFTGAVSLGTGGSLSSGMTAWMVGTGWWLEYNAGTPRMAIGNPTTDYFNWDGTGVNISSTTGISVINTNNLNDNGNLGETATWGQINGIPITLAGYGITDGQQLLPIPSAVKSVLYGNGTAYSVTNATWSGGVATVTIGAHNIPVGATALVQNISPIGYNGTGLLITGITATTISYAVANNPGSYSSGGSVLNVLYFAPSWDETFDSYGDALGNTSVTSTVGVIWGNKTIAMPQPTAQVLQGGSVTIMMWASGYVNNDTVNINTAVALLQYSTDGGNTFSNSNNIYVTLPATSGARGALCPALTVNSVVPTGDIQVRCNVALSAGTNSMTFTNGKIMMLVLPNNEGYSIATITALAASVPGTAAGNCSATFPATTCTASATASVTASQGLPPYTVYSWAKVSGADSITAGATSRTATVSGTHTTSDAGATSTTTIACTVTDSQTYTTSSGSESGTTVTLILTASHGIPVGGKFNVSGCTPSGYNGTNLTALSGSTGTTLKYTAGAGLGVITVQGTVNNVHVTSSNCVVTLTYYRSYSAVTNSISGTNPKCTQSGGNSCTASAVLTNNPSGGDGAYTYSNVKTSGSSTAAVTAGATSQSFTVSDTHVVGTPASTSALFTGTVTDGHSNVGSGTKNITFQFWSNT